jgi:hypothetical protein
MKLRCAICLSLLGAFAVVGAAPAAAETPFPPGGFRLSASNGYSLHALSFDGDPRGEHDELILFFDRKGAEATYFALHRVTVTETTIAAALGGLGSIDLHFVPSGRTTKEHPRCEPRQSVEFDSGFYEGRIDFEGEEGFTEVHATRAAGDLQLGLNLICPGGPRVDGAGPGLPGALLHARRRWSKGSLEMQARTNSPTRPTSFEASIEERGPTLPVIRSVAVSGAPATFRYDVSAQAARLAPPPPFAGVAGFDRAGKRQGHLHAGLTVDFPGRSGVSLAGLRGGLSRYIANPSHPRRPFLRRDLERIAPR